MAAKAAGGGCGVNAASGDGCGEERPASGRWARAAVGGLFAIRGEDLGVGAGSGGGRAVRNTGATLGR